MAKKKILFTGGSGLLALNWALLPADAYDVVLGLHKKNISVNNLVTMIIDMETITGFSAVLENIKPDIVIHCAGLANVEACEADPSMAYHVNVELSVNVAGACKMHGIHFVYISTDHLFSGKKALVSEDEIPSPVNEYGKTKLEAEKKILEISDRFLSIRTNFYGWGPAYRQSFSDMIITNIRNKKPVSLFEDFYYTPILIEELGYTVMELVSKHANGIFNVTGNERISKSVFGNRVADRFGLDKSLIRISKFSERKDLVKRPADLSLSNKKVCTFLNREVGNIDANIEKLFLQEKTGFSNIIQNV